MMQMKIHSVKNLPIKSLLPHLKNSASEEFYEKKKKTITQLQDKQLEHLSVISDLKDEVLLLKSKIDNMKKYVRMLNDSSNVLDKILQAGRNAGNIEGLGYNNQDVINRKEHVVKVVYLKKKTYVKLDVPTSAETSKKLLRKQTSIVEMPLLWKVWSFKT